MKRLVLALVLLVWVSGAVAHANPLDAFGFGARGAAMGGAQTAATDDAYANYYNPGALALGDQIRFALGYQLASPSLSIDGGDQNVDSSRGFQLGLAIPGRIGPVHIAFGLGVFLPDDHLVRLRTLPSSRPRWVVYDNRPHRFFLGTNLAVRVGETLFIGAGIGYMSRTQGDIKLIGRVGYPNENDSELALDMNVSLFSVRYPQAGILWRAQPWLDLGATYRGGFVLSLDLAVDIMGDLGPEAAPLVKDAFFKLHTVSFDLFQPEQVAAGFSARISRNLLVAGDVTWARWSEFDNPAARIEILYDLKEFNSLVNLPGALPLEKAYFHDTFSPRIGLELTASRGRKATWMVRAGYAFDPTPAPEQRGETNFIDNDKHTISAGLGLQLSGVTDVLPFPFDVDLYVSESFLPERVHRKLSAIDSIGDYTSGGSIFAMGITTRWQL